GVLLVEGVKAGEELLRVGLVERGRLEQFGHGIGQRLLLADIKVSVLLRCFGEHIEASAQIRERGLEGPERKRDRRTLSANAAEVVLHQAQETLPLAAIEPHDRRKVVRL